MNIGATGAQLIRSAKEGRLNLSANSSVAAVPLPSALDLADRSNHHSGMEPVTPRELDARIEAIEARMEARIASIGGKIDTMLAKMDERDRSYDQRFSGVEETLKETKSAISSLKTTMIVTALSAVLAIVFGVAAFNATVLSNMVASFESGKNTAAAIEKAAQDLKAVQDRIPPKK